MFSARTHQTRLEEQQMLVRDFNQNYPPGTPCIVKLDDGTDLTTKMRSKAWVNQSYTAVCVIEGSYRIYAVADLRMEGARESKTLQGGLAL